MPRYFRYKCGVDWVALGTKIYSPQPRWMPPCGWQSRVQAAVIQESALTTRGSMDRGNVIQGRESAQSVFDVFSQRWVRHSYTVYKHGAATVKSWESETLLRGPSRSQHQSIDKVPHVVRNEVICNDAMYRKRGPQPAKHFCIFKWSESLSNDRTPALAIVETGWWFLKVPSEKWS